jgi:hypothetical protein
MLTQLTTIKARLAILDSDSTYDALLTNAIKAVSARFDNECNRKFARATNTTHEFSAEELELRLSCYPIESISKFELKSNETEGWSEQAGVEFLVRGQCVLSLALPLGTFRQQARVTYTGGYVLPGTIPGAGETALPDDLEQAAVEQVAYWYSHREKLGLVRLWPHDGTYETFAKLDLLSEVKAVLVKYERWEC